VRLHWRARQRDVDTGEGPRGYRRYLRDGHCVAWPKEPTGREITDDPSDMRELYIYIYAHAYATDRQIDGWICKVVLREGSALALLGLKSQPTEAITDMCEYL